jgi:hypothetical protein
VSARVSKDGVLVWSKRRIEFWKAYCYRVHKLLSFVGLLSKTPKTKACKIGILSFLCIIIARSLTVTKKEDTDLWQLRDLRLSWR